MRLSYLVRSLAFLGCGVSLSLVLPAQQAPARGGVDLTIPAAIGPFQLVKQRPLDQAAGGGFVLTFRRADSLEADVFLYPGPDLATKCGVDCARTVMQNEGDGFITLFPEMQRRKYVDTISVRADSVLVPPADAQWTMGRVLRLEEVRDGKPRWSDFYLMYAAGFRVKVRATYPREVANVTAIGEFAAQVVGALIMPATAPPDGTP